MNNATYARSLGGEARGNRIHCPGPGHSRADRSLSVTFTPDAPGGFVVNSFAGDDPILCRDYVRDRLGLPAFAPGKSKPSYTRMPKPSHGEPNKSIYALKLWSEAMPVPLTPAETYCLARVPFLAVEVFKADALRFHPACPFRHNITAEIFRTHAMLALLRDIVTDAPRAIQRIALRPDGKGKADMPDGGDPKRMLGPAKGCAVKLSPDDDVTQGLSITEGTETALTVYSFRIRPVWVAGSSGAIQTFPVMPGIEALTIYADNDKNRTGQKAARACAERWRDASCECVIRQPRRTGADWNDLAEGMRHD